MESENPILQTTHGHIKGIKRTTIYDDTYYSFERIPYAKPPLGHLRFRSPQPANPWSEILDCTDFGEMPLQKNLFTGVIEGSEDCLFLNVYVKALTTNKPLPVMFYIYGGAFQNGEATRNLLSPDYFMQENVILVTCNYRLGPLGFLCLNDSELRIPGNAGLKDQLAALTWFKNNCQFFNGDPNNITIFGNSAGGTSVHYLMVTEKAKGLFHKAIPMSGTVYNLWSNAPHGDYAFRLAKVNGYEGNNNEKDIYDYLMKTDGSKLVGHDLATEEEKIKFHGILFGPTTEPYISDDCIVPEHPEITAKNTWSKDIPVMVGGTSFEGLLSYVKAKTDKKIWRIIEKQPAALLPYVVREKIPEDESEKLGTELRKLHFSDTDILEENVFKYLEFISYKVFWHGFQRTIRSRLTYANADTYLYRFDYDSPTFNLFRLKYCGPEIRGVAHADDLSYLFYGSQSWKLSKDSEEYKMIKLMVGIWTSFATYGNPNCTKMLPITWEPVQNSYPDQCLNISNEVRQINLPEAEKLKFWNDLYDKIC